MALSDQLEKLANQARTLEASAADVKARNDVKVQARITELHDSLEATRVEIGDDLIAEGDQETKDWAAMQQNVSETFDSLHARAAARRAAHKAKRAETVAEDSEWDAADAVDFEVYAIQEAEYALLQAAADRDAADELKS
ncbi:MAG TPA: hypothetical protein VGM94_08145 [Galbitalea sp.]|jgi:hypothetical protein